MLTLVFGAPGTGKTTYLFKRILEDLAEGIPSFLIVPEQNTVSVEASAAALLPPNAPLLFEVTNFTRLADTVFRRVGGVATRYADEATAALLTREALAEVAPLLTDKRRIDPARVREALHTVRELKTSGITPEMMQAAAADIGSTEGLSEKLSDLALLLSGFEGTLAAHATALPIDGLERLADVLAGALPLAGAHFYLDGFTSFTAVQRRVMAGLCRGGEMTITLPMPAGDNDNALAFAEIRRTLRDLRLLAARADIPTETVSLEGNKRARHPLLSAIGDRLFRVGVSPIPDEVPTDALRIFSCRTPYAEAELVAADIAARVQAGARYRDFAIVARNAADYRGVLDTALERHGIPAFFSLPTDLSSYEAVKLIRSAYAILTENYRREDVITYAKCGLSGITDDECDRFELYAERWRLTGHRLLHSPFRMYPAGYSLRPYAGERERAEAALTELNDIRERILAPLSIIEASCKESLTVKEHCNILHSFLTALDVDARLYERAKVYAAAGDAVRADEYARLYPAVIGALTRLCDCVPEARMSGAEFSELLSLVFSTESLSTIPQRTDAVTVGSADLLRPNEPRNVYLIGANAGVFPRGGEESGIFSTAELARLADYGIVLDGDEMVRASREYYCFLRAFLAASESVTITYYAADFTFSAIGRSEAVDRLIALCGNRISAISEETLPLFDRLLSAEAAATALAAPLSDTERAAILRVLNSTPERRALAERSTAPLTDPHASAGEEIMAALYRGRMQLSQTRIEQYAECPFSFFCKNVLRLDDTHRITFGSTDIGTYTHAVLEHFYARYSRTEMADLTDDAIRDEIERLTAEYIKALFPEGVTPPPRLAHRFARIGSMAVRMVCELQNEARLSEFEPLFFEYEPSAEDVSRPAPLLITLADGTRVSLIGKIDRVDVYRSGENAYLRVVDYKTGKKDFSLDDVARGKNLQMLIYLFTLWKSDRPEFLRTLGSADGARPLPAGVVYLNLSLTNPRIEAPADTPPPLTKRSGLFLDTSEVLTAFDASEPKVLIPIKYDKNGEPDKTSRRALATLEDMGRLADEVEATVRGIAEGIRCGRADATPLVSGRKTPCTYCAYYPICRNVTKKPENTANEA